MPPHSHFSFTFKPEVPKFIYECFTTQHVDYNKRFLIFFVILLWNSYVCLEFQKDSWKVYLFHFLYLCICCNFYNFMYNFMLFELSSLFFFLFCLVNLHCTYVIGCLQEFKFSCNVVKASLITDQRALFPSQNKYKTWPSEP